MITLRRPWYFSWIRNIFYLAIATHWTLAQIWIFAKQKNSNKNLYGKSFIKCPWAIIVNNKKQPFARIYIYIVWTSISIIILALSALSLWYKSNCAYRFSFKYHDAMLLWCDAGSWSQIIQQCPTLTHSKYVSHFVITYIKSPV